MAARRTTPRRRTQNVQRRLLRNPRTGRRNLEEGQDAPETQALPARAPESLARAVDAEVGELIETGV